MTLGTLLILIAIFGSLADAVPTITFPINSQVPPVARVAKPYSFTFSNSTFSSPLPLSYSLSYGPSWLSLSNTLTLSGIASLDDVGDGTVTAFAVGLTATDSTGSSTLNATLVVSKDTGPVVHIPASSQIEKFGAISAPSTLTYHPSTPFKFKFDSNTFAAGGSNTTLLYYAVTTDNTPLPSWVDFDSASLAFSGQTPDYQSLIQPPQTFGISLVASDVPGFSGTSISFYIEVGIHVLSFDAENLVMNVTRGTIVNFDGLSKSLQLDGRAVQSSDLSIVTAQTPDWINLNNISLALYGMVPPNAYPYNITFQASDIYGDTATMVVFMNVLTTIDSSSVPTVSSIDNGIASRTSKASSASSTNTADAHTNLSSGSHKMSAGIWLAIFIPIGILFLGLLVAVFYYHRRRQMVKEPPAPPLKREISPPINNTSSIEIIITPPRVSPPRPLSLDMSGFSHHHSISSISSLSQDGKIERNQTINSNNVSMEGLRRPKSMDVGSDAARESQPQGSDNGLSMIESSWRSTKDSAYSMENSFRNPSHQSLERVRFQKEQQLSRNYSNYSRKGHSRCSARVVSFQSLDGIRPSSQGISSMAQQTQNSNSSLEDNKLPSNPINTISTPKRSSYNVQQRESVYSRDKIVPPTIRYSRFIPTIETTYMGIGHGSRSSVLSVSGMGRNRKSIGHGQDKNISRRTQRESKAWLAVASKDISEHVRESMLSASSEYEDTVPRPTVGKPTIRQVTHSPSIQASESSGNSRLSRPISRRIGTSPFFSSGHSRKSLKTPKRVRISYADSPTVPEEGPLSNISLVETIQHGLREESSGQPRDSFGISYGLAREGTRQLRSYLKSQLSRSRTGQSMRSNDSRDSRFESATTSILSLPQSPLERQGQSGFEDYMQETLSEGSWETAPRTIIDSDGNMFHGQGEREETAQAVAAVIKSGVNGGENATGSEEDLGIGPNAKIVRGAGRRPVSSDGMPKKTANRAAVEGREEDYTAYI